MRPVAILSATLLFLTGCSTEPPATEPTAVLFEGARLISGNTPPVENSAFLMENGKITKVGTKGQVEAPAGAVRVDLTGKTVIPAIVDAHAHLGWQIIKTGQIGKDTYSKENLIDHLTRVEFLCVSCFDIVLF
jgi:imidazolonepropionase-like amidohydrolase